MTSRKSSGSIRAESALEPTRSQNITGTWRRSARSSGDALGTAGVLAVSTEGGLPLPSFRRAAMASRSLRRCPTAVTPSSFRVSCVRLGRTVSSMSFSRNAASYFPRRLDDIPGVGPATRSGQGGISQPGSGSCRSKTLLFAPLVPLLLGEMIGACRRSAADREATGTV
jgi:hypothetical protein